MVIFLNFEFLSNYYPRGELKNMSFFFFFFLKQKWKKWQYQYQCQSFLLYYRKNCFSTIGFLKSKRASLCNKRKLPSLIKFRKKQKVQNRTVHTEKVCNVTSVGNHENSSFDFEYWYMEQQGQPLRPPPVERHDRQDLRRFLASDPAFRVFWASPLCEDQTVR